MLLEWNLIKINILTASVLYFSLNLYNCNWKGLMYVQLWSIVIIIVNFKFNYEKDEEEE